LDGPVVRAAAHALATGRVESILPFVPADGEAEVRSAFDRTVAVRGTSAEVGDLGSVVLRDGRARPPRR
jgi:hypothetical protein